MRLCFKNPGGQRARHAVGLNPRHPFVLSESHESDREPESCSNNKKGRSGCQNGSRRFKFATAKVQDHEVIILMSSGSGVFGFDDSTLQGPTSQWFMAGPVQSSWSGTSQGTH